MDFALSSTAQDYVKRLEDFMDSDVYPDEPVYGQQREEMTADGRGDRSRRSSRSSRPRRAAAGCGTCSCPTSPA